MAKQDPKKQVSFELNEQGANEVSEQIMDAYNSGFIDQGSTANVDSEEVQGTEG
ncbi:hypothetical protein [Neobacillus sp. FSL H8-0543]|uniref:hypothetical protein n=1 Tax=Neobacillus sp. FSL H8-0543 TaxID=2954672 RepID=UPI0031598057